MTRRFLNGETWLSKPQSLPGKKGTKVSYSHAEGTR